MYKKCKNYLEKYILIKENAINKNFENIYSD